MADTEFTIGTAGDYADHILFSAARGEINDGNRQVGRMISDVTMSALFRPNQSWPNLCLFTSNKTVTGKAGDGWTLGNTAGARVCLSPSANVDFEDIEIDVGSNTYAFQNNGGSTFTRVIMATGDNLPLVDTINTYNNCVLNTLTQSASTTAGSIITNNCTIIDRMLVRGNNLWKSLNCNSIAANWYLGQPIDAGAVSETNFCYIRENVPENEFGPLSSDNTINTDTTLEMVNFAGGDYRIKSTSVLATAGQGGTFVGAFLEAASGVSLTVDSGIYSQTGTNTPLFASRILQADTSSYSHAGTTTPLRAELNILTTSGSYLLTGSDLNLKAARKLITETGSYNLTGTDVTLIYTPSGGGEILVVDSGVYSLAGDELLLSAQLNIIGNSGNYLLSGTETRIAYNANIITDTGSYSLTGSNINLFANYGMIVLSTSYTLTGTSVTLKYSGDTNQIIGTVTAGFAPDLYSVGYKQNTITVTFKE